MRYEDTVRRVCGENWKTVNHQEKEGGIGVAIVQAYLRGTKPSVMDMAQNLGINPDEIVAPFSRLARNGVFSYAFNAKKDPILNASLGDDETHRAWGHIAGTASGFIGV